MFPRILAALRENYIGLQVWALVIYLVLDACGLGLGIFNHIINRPLANTGKFHIGNLFVGAPPIGPIRLTHTDRTAANARIATAFAGAPPKTTQLGEMLSFYRPT